MIGNSSFKVGIYIRLSRDDGNIESDSIISQRSLLNQYIKENNYSLIDEYVDDGFTGTNFERPSFKRMIKDIESGKINMIITKDDCVIIEPTQKDLENQGFVAGSICF